jgi:hypothetical protein
MLAIDKIDAGLAGLPFWMNLDPSTPRTAASARALLSSSDSHSLSSLASPAGGKMSGLLGGSRSCCPNAGTGNSLNLRLLHNDPALPAPVLSVARRSCAAIPMNACRQTPQAAVGQAGM